MNLDDKTLDDKAHDDMSLEDIDLGIMDAYEAEEPAYTITPSPKWSGLDVFMLEAEQGMHASMPVKVAPEDQEPNVQPASQLAAVQNVDAPTTPHYPPGRASYATVPVVSPSPIAKRLVAPSPTPVPTLLRSNVSQHALDQTSIMLDCTREWRYPR